MTITVLVPDAAGVAALAGIENVEAVRYRPGEPWPAEAAKATVLVPRFLSTDDVRGQLAELPALRYVQLLTAGAELWIGQVPDGVLLSVCRGAHGGSTAEWVVGALVSIYREFDVFGAAHAQGRWDQHSTDTVQDKRVLIVGAGELAEQLTRRLIPFDATCTLVGRSGRDGVHPVSALPELLPEHDVTVLVVPLTTETTGMVDAEFLARMPDGAVLVNAARGPVVRTDDLLAELNSGRLRAALDVTDPEPLPPGHPLWTAPGLFLTPHVGGSCTGRERRSWRVAAAEIARFAAGEQPHNLVHGEY